MYVDIATLQTIAAGQPLSAATVQQIRDNGEFFIDPPACSVFNSAAQSLSSGSTTALTANSENYDNNSMHSTASNTSRITAQTAGRYLFLTTVEFDTHSTGRRLVYLRFNGTTDYLLYSAPAPTSPTTAAATVAKSLVLAAGQYAEVLANQNSGGALGVTLQEFIAVFITR